jgi:hypothetical protein
MELQAVTMPTTTPEFLPWAGKLHRDFAAGLRAGQVDPERLRMHLTAEMHDDAAECYERAQRDFAAQAEEIERLRGILIAEGYDFGVAAPREET